MNQVLSNNMIKALKDAGKRGLSFRELTYSCKVTSPAAQREFRECLRALIAKGDVIDRKIKIYAAGALELKPAVVTRINKTYGFVKLTEDDSEMFIPGKFFIGALPGDSVLVSEIPARGSSPEGEIVKITHESDCTFTGTLIAEAGGFCVSPDSVMRFPIEVSKENMGGAEVGDKVLCAVTKRGERHSDHKIKVITVFGDGQKAQYCADAVLELNGISQGFSDEIEVIAKQLNTEGIAEREIARRLDLRDERIFTIDGADTKDIDDAISLKKLGEYYELGVHIADVSHYVTKGSPIDDEAFERGTSIYFADRVIPMLPKALSNGICSLNEGVDRLAFSCIMTIDKNGKLVDFDFKKSVIRSRVKGVYSEINQLLSETAGEELQKKYKAVSESIKLMKGLADIFTRNKKARGAPEIETSESVIVLDDNCVAVDIKPRTRGASEVMIEEFMLMANEAAASAARLKEIPFVYRVHEPPSTEKLEHLKELLSALGLPTTDVKPDMPTLVLSKLLEASKDKPIYPLVNTSVLRSMSKAKYYQEPLGHYGLVLENYAQFTSPIRRYPDLEIHRILSEVCHGTPLPKVRKLFEKEAIKVALRSTETELAAMRLERDCDDCYHAEYMKSHIGEDFDGIISGLAPHGIYVELPNTVEGLLKTENMPSGEYDFDGLLTYTEVLSGKTYRIGDAIRVRCINADVAAGNVDFAVL